MPSEVSFAAKVDITFITSVLNITSTTYANMPSKIPYTRPATTPAFAPKPAFPILDYNSYIFKFCSIYYRTHILIID